MNNKLFIYIFLISVIAIGAKSITNLQYEVDLKGYNLAPQEDIHNYNQFVKGIDSTVYESSIVILENSNTWSTLESFKIIDSISYVLNSRPEIQQSFSIVDLKYPKKRLIRPALQPFLNLKNQELFDKRIQNINAYKDIFEKFISTDRLFTLIFLETTSPLTNDSKAAVQDQIRLYKNITVHYNLPDDKEGELVKRLNTDTYVLGIISLLLILGGFYFFTHSLKGLALITIMVAFNIAVTFICIDVLNISLTMHMVTIPCLIIILSFTDIMHLMYYQNVYKSKSKNNRHLQKQILQRLQLPLLLTSITNIIGFIIFLILSNNPFLIDYSIAATLGVIAAYLSSRFIVIKLMQKDTEFIKRNSFASIIRVHESISNSIQKFRIPTIILTLAIGLVIISYVFIYFEIENNDQEIIGSDTATTILQKSFFGSHQAEVFITLSGDSIWNSQHLAHFDSIESNISRIFSLLYINGPSTLVKRYNRYVHNGRTEAFQLPASMGKLYVHDLVKTIQDLGGQGIVNDENSKARIIFGYSSPSLKEARAQYAQLRNVLEEFNSKSIQYTLSGLQVLSNESTYSFSIKLIYGFAGSIILGCIIIMFLLRSVRAGLFFLFVNLIPIGLALALLIFFHIAITPLVLFLLSILLGVCIDDSIYLIIQKKNDHTFSRVIPIFITSIVLSIGFISFTISEFQWIQPFGYIIPIGIMVAYILDISVLKTWRLD